jgi:hypothetical protein
MERPAFVTCRICGHQVPVTNVRGPVPDGHRECLDLANDLDRLRRDAKAVLVVLSDDKDARLRVYQWMKSELFRWLEQTWMEDRRGPDGRMIKLLR